MGNNKLIERVELNDELLDMVSGGTFPVEEVERIINLYYTLREKNPAYEKEIAALFVSACADNRTYTYDQLVSMLKDNPVIHM